MSISSLILRSNTILAFILCTFFDSTSAQSTPVYTLDTEYSGNSFFDGFNFFDEADPTHGFVTYVDESTAASSGLIKTGTGFARMNVDSTHTYNPNTAYSGVNGLGRPSVRIESKKSWTHGLFVAKIDHMPGGICGTWPALWTLGSGEWPYNGEIDIIEGVNNRKQNVAALHTGGEATITNGQSNNCQWSGGNGVGCTIADPDTASYGTQYNAQGGGTYAMQWTSSAIKIWSFPYGQVPANVNSANPDPSTWGTPSQTFSGSDLHIDSNFKEHRMIFDTTFCGDFADAVWTSDGCAAQTGYSTCAAYVAKNPSAFADAYWQVGYVRVFQQSGSSTSALNSATTTLRPSSTSASIPAMSSSSSNSPFSLGPAITRQTSSTTTSSAPISFLHDTSEGTVTVTLLGSSATTSTLTLMHVGSSTTSLHTTLSTVTTKPTPPSSTTLDTPTMGSGSSSSSPGSMEMGSPILASTSHQGVSATPSTSTSSVAYVPPYYGNVTATSNAAAESSPGAFSTVSKSVSDASSPTSTTSTPTSPVSSAADAGVTSTADVYASSTVMFMTPSTTDAITHTVIPILASPSPSATQSDATTSPIQSDTLDSDSDPNSTDTISIPTSTLPPAISTPTDPSAQASPINLGLSPHRHGHWRGSFLRGGLNPFLRTRNIEPRAFPGANPFQRNNYVSRIEYVCPSTKKRNAAAAADATPDTEVHARADEAVPATQPQAEAEVEAEAEAEAETETAQLPPRSLPASIGQLYPAPPVEAATATASANPTPGAGWLKIACVGMMMGAFWILGMM